jgi:hypothetical protein
MVIPAVYNRQKIEGTGWRYRPLTVGQPGSAEACGRRFCVRKLSNSAMPARGDTSNSFPKPPRTASFSSPRQGSPTQRSVNNLVTLCNASASLRRMLFAVAADKFLEVLAGIHDVIPQRLGSDFGIPCATSGQKFSVRFAGEMQVAREDQVKARVAIAVVVDGLQESEHHWALGGRVQR